MNKLSVWGKGEKIARSGGKGKGKRLLSFPFPLFAIFSPLPQTESLFTGYENPRFASRGVRKNECLTVQPMKRLCNCVWWANKNGENKEIKESRLTSEQDAPFIIHIDLVRTKAPAQMLIWHISSVNQGGSFGGGYGREINEICALALEIHQALKQENTTAETQTEIWGCKGMGIWSPEPQFLRKEIFLFVFSLRNSRFFFFYFISKSVLLRRRRDIARSAYASHACMFRVSPQSH